MDRKGLKGANSSLYGHDWVFELVEMRWLCRYIAPNWTISWNEDFHVCWNWSVKQCFPKWVRVYLLIGVRMVWCLMDYSTTALGLCITSLRHCNRERFKV